MWNVEVDARARRGARPGPHESGASSTRSSSHGFLASQTSIGVNRVAASETCIRLLAPSPRACAPWPIGCGAPSVHGSPVPSRSPHQTSAQMSPPLQAGTASGSASAERLVDHLDRLVAGPAVEEAGRRVQRVEQRARLA